MPPQQPQLDINQLRSDPDFQGLAPGEQHKVLSKAFPDYAALPGQEQGAVMDRLTGRNQVPPAGLPAGTSLPGFPAPPNPMKDNLAYVAPDVPSPTFSDVVNRQKQMWNQAGQDVKDTYQGAKQGVKNWMDKPAGEKLGSVVMAPLAAAIGAGETVGHAGSRLFEGHPVDAASQLMGGDPDKADQLDAQGNHGAADWERFGKPAVLAAASEAGARAMTGMTSLVIGPTEGARANDAFASWIAGGVKNGAPQETAAAVRPIFKQAAADVGLKDENGWQKMFKGDTPTRGPGITANDKGIRKTVQGMKKGIEVADRAVNIADAPMQAVIDQAKNDIVPQPVKDNIIQGLKAKSVAARGVGNDSLANAYDTIAKTVGENKTYGELNEVKRNANDQTEGMGGKGSPSEKAAAAILPVKAWRDTGDLIRNNMYPELQQRYIPQPGQPGYFDVRAMGQREAQVLDARDGIYKGYDQAAHLDAPYGAKNMSEKVSEGSMYSTHVLKRITGIEPSPAGKFNVMMRRGIGEIGTGGTPESVSVLPKSADIAKITSTPEFKAMSPDAQRDYLAKMTPKGMQPRLPAPPGYAQFDMPIPGNPETSQGSSVIPAQANYNGTEAVPNPAHQPITGPSRVQQRQELGSTADTIPNSVLGAQSPARVRADQIGLGHDPNVGRVGIPPPPTRSITGEPTINRSKWQFVSAPADATQIVDRGTRGVFRTNDPIEAQRALDGMDSHISKIDSQIKSSQDRMKSADFKNLSREEQAKEGRILDTNKQAQYEAKQSADSLRDKLKSHAKVQNSPRPAEFEIHWDPGNPAKFRGRQTGIIKRVATYGSRAGMQAQPGQLTPPPYSQQDVDSEQQLMSQPQ